jgi:hypothetical protein
MLQVTSIPQLSVSRLSRQCEILNISQPYRPPRPVMGIALLYFYLRSRRGGADRFCENVYPKRNMHTNVSLEE